jgi:hypothetical protein
MKKMQGLLLNSGTFLKRFDIFMQLRFSLDGVTTDKMSSLILIY